MRTHRASTRHRLPEATTRRALAAALIVASAACATVDTAVVANPGAEFNLALGQTAALSGTAYRITFDRVSEDSRCAVDVVCVWAGDAKIQLTISSSTAPANIQIVSLTPPNSEVTSGNLKIRFVSLAPAPKSSEPRESRKYVARLLVGSP